MTKTFFQHQERNISNLLMGLGQMFSKLLFALPLLLVQYVHGEPALNFCNRTPSKIDSIVLSGTDSRTLQSILPGTCKALDIPFEWLNTHGVGLCDYKIYFNNKFFTGQILKGISNDTVFVDRDRTSQSRFTIFISNLSQSAVEKILPLNGSIDTSFEVTPRVRTIEVNYDKFSKDPKLEIVSNGKPYLVSLAEHNFSNLSNPTASVWISDSTILPGIPPFRYMTEFTMVLQAATSNINLTSIKIISPALTAVYDQSNGEGKTLIFDFARLRVNPHFTVIVDGKRLKIKLPEKDLSEVYYGRKYFYVYKDSIRQQ